MQIYLKLNFFQYPITKDPVLTKIRLFWGAKKNISLFVKLLQLLKVYSWWNVKILKFQPMKKVTQHIYWCVFEKKKIKSCYEYRNRRDILHTYEMKLKFPRNLMTKNETNLINKLKWKVSFSQKRYSKIFENSQYDPLN